MIREAKDAFRGYFHFQANRRPLALTLVCLFISPIAH